MLNGLEPIFAPFSVIDVHLLRRLYVFICEFIPFNSKGIINLARRISEASRDRHDPALV